MTQPEAARVERGPITEVPHFALGMAALLERQGFTVAANELRRLHAQRDALLEALKLIVEFVDAPTEGKRPDVFVMRISKARAVIKAAEENT